MNTKELTGKVNAAMYRQCRDRGYAAPVDVLMEIGYLSQKDYENWRYGRVDYLERVCKANLSKLSTAMRQVRGYARNAGLKPSYCCYKQWAVKKRNGQGRKPVILLRFSKSGAPEIERNYATHYVDTKRISQLKAEKASPDTQAEGGSDGGSSNS